MRRRGCLITAGIFVLLVLVCAGVVWFVAIPRVQDNVTTEIARSLSTEVSTLLEGTPASTGTQTLSVTTLNSQFAATLSDVNDAKISVNPGGLALTFNSGNQRFGYTGTPTVEDGKLKMTDMKVDNGALGWFLPADKLGDAIETGVNDYFSAKGLQIDSLQLGNDEIIFTTSKKP